jgi:hypothetical protein
MIGNMNTFPYSDEKVFELQKRFVHATSYGDLIETLDGINIRDHPLFSLLIHLTPFQVKRMLAPFFYAVAEWPVILRHLQTRIKDTNPKASIIIQNILEEDAGNDSKPSHIETYHYFLNSLSSQLVLTRDSKAVAEFNRELLEYVIGSEPALTMAVLAGIERSYFEVSKILNEYCQHHRIVQKHYSNYEQIGVFNSDELIEAAIDLQCSMSELIEGTITGYKLIWIIYEKLYREFFQSY